MENCLEDLDSAIKFGLETHDNNTLKQVNISHTFNIPKLTLILFRHTLNVV